MPAAVMDRIISNAGFPQYRIGQDLGVTSIIGGAPSGRYSINGAIMRRAMANGQEDVEQVMPQTA